MDNIVDDKLISMRRAVENLTDKQRTEFKSISDLLIALGRVKPLEDALALEQAIDSVAFDITMLSAKSFREAPELSTAEVLDTAPMQEKVAQLDTAIHAIAFGSGVHKAIVDLMVAERVDYHIAQIEKDFEKFQAEKS